MRPLGEHETGAAAHEMGLAAHSYRVCAANPQVYAPASSRSEVKVKQGKG